MDALRRTVHTGSVGDERTACDLMSMGRSSPSTAPSFFVAPLRVLLLSFQDPSFPWADGQTAALLLACLLVS